MTSASFEFDGGELVARLSRMDAGIDRAIAGAMSYHATRAVAYARQNARWTDRTGNARNGLFARVNRASMGKYEMILGHSVPYGLWLEVRWSGRYAIVKPTLDVEGRELMTTLSRMFNGGL